MTLITQHVITLTHQNFHCWRLGALRSSGSTDVRIIIGLTPVIHLHITILFKLIFLSFQISPNYIQIFFSHFVHFYIIAKLTFNLTSKPINQAFSISKWQPQSYRNKSQTPHKSIFILKFIHFEETLKNLHLNLPHWEILINVHWSIAQFHHTHPNTFQKHPNHLQNSYSTWIWVLKICFNLILVGRGKRDHKESKSTKESENKASLEPGQSFIRIWVSLPESSSTFILFLSKPLQVSHDSFQLFDLFAHFTFYTLRALNRLINFTK